MKHTLLSVAIGMLALLLTACYNQEPREQILKVYNWADYID